MPEQCPCASLDWGNIDQTLPHHPQCDWRYVQTYVGLGSVDPDSAVRVASCRPVNTDVSSRRGRFVITLDEAVHYDAEALTRLMALFGQMVITRCETMWDTRAFEYSAVSRLFDPIPDGERPPWYKLECSDGHWAARREK